MLVMFCFKLHRSKPWPISAFEYFGHTGPSSRISIRGKREIPRKARLAVPKEETMPYSVRHEYVNLFDTTAVVAVAGHPRTVRVEYLASGDLPIRHPGRLSVFAQAYTFVRSGRRHTGKDALLNW